MVFEMYYYGADPNTTDMKGVSPLEYALLQEHFVGMAGDPLVYRNSSAHVNHTKWKDKIVHSNVLTSKSNSVGRHITDQYNSYQVECSVIV